MSLKDIVEVVDRLNAIAFHIRSGKLVEGEMLQCSVCNRYYSIRKFASHKCIHATTPINEIQTILDTLRKKTNNDFSQYKEMTFEEAYNEWFKKSTKNNE